MGGVESLLAVSASLLAASHIKISHYPNADPRKRVYLLKVYCITRVYNLYREVAGTNVFLENGIIADKKPFKCKY